MNNGRLWFLIEDIAVQRAKLIIPAFTKEKQQLSQKEVEFIRQTANVCIHVECIIGLLIEEQIHISSCSGDFVLSKFA